MALAPGELRPCVGDVPALTDARGASAARDEVAHLLSGIPAGIEQDATIAWLLAALAKPLGKRPSILALRGGHGPAPRLIGYHAPPACSVRPCQWLFVHLFGCQNSVCKVLDHPLDVARRSFEIRREADRPSCVAVPRHSGSTPDARGFSVPQYPTR